MIDKYLLLKEKLKNRQKIIMANLMITQSPLLINAFQKADCILLDKEHGIYGTEELIPLTMQCRSLGIPSIVRVEDKLYHLIAKAVDLGADGIMLPRTETSEQVKTAIDAMYFYPLGKTGVGGWGLFRGKAFEYNEFQESRVLIVQIESPEGLSNMEQMIREYGDHIDGFVIGPNDYSVMMGLPFQLDHPAMVEEYRKFFEICMKYNKSCGIFDPDTAHAKRDAGMGANIFWIGDDFSYMKSGFEKLIEEI